MIKYVQYTIPHKLILLLIILLEHAKKFVSNFNLFQSDVH